MEVSFANSHHCEGLVSGGNRGTEWAEGSDDCGKYCHWVAGQMLKDVIEFKPVEIDTDIATCAVRRMVSGRSVVNLVTF